MTELLSAWAQISLDHPPYGLPADLAVLGDSGRHTVVFRSYEESVARGLENPTDSRFHLGLLPQPWFGDLETATAYLLLLNPGLHPGDYFGEYRVPAVRRALLNNLQQKPGREYPLLFLDPEFAWHSGARYFRARLHWLAVEIAEQRGLPYLVALSDVARQVCCLQLVPYHSVRYSLAVQTFRRLESPNLIKAFVRDHLLSRPGVLVIVTRGPWKLEERKGVIVYRGSETRAAHLSPGSRGGRALAAHFGLSIR